MLTAALLAGCLSAPATRIGTAPPGLAVTHRLSGLTLLGLRHDGWTRATIDHWSSGLHRRLGECGIAVDGVQIAFSDAPGAVAAARQARGPGLLIVFADNTGTDAAGRASGGVTRRLDDGRQFATIARRSPSGRRLRPEQTVMHELGHLLGLAHSPKVNARGAANIDLMHPRGCLYCRFTSDQCGAMRAHASVRRMR